MPLARSSVNVTYRDDYRVFELPPNPQGLAALQMLNILEGYQIGGEDGMVRARLQLIVVPQVHNDRACS